MFNLFEQMEVSCAHTEEEERRIQTAGIKGVSAASIFIPCVSTCKDLLLFPRPDHGDPASSCRIQRERVRNFQQLAYASEVF